MSKQSTSKTTTETEEVVIPAETPVCGVIMPIAKTDGYNDSHWADVYSILCEVAAEAGFNPNLVSFDDDVGIIHKRIVQNIYSNPIVICDISSRNANVMLELGMRLAFDKPTIIIKDNKTPYSFDIAAIEHLEYPSDLRYQLINEFKIKLKNKLVETHRRSSSDPEFTTFLKHFGTFKVAKLDQREVTGEEYLAAEVRDLKELVLNSMVLNAKSISESSISSRSDFNRKNTETLRVQFEHPLPETLSFSALGVYLQKNGIEVISLKRSRDNLSLIAEYMRLPSTPPLSVISKLIREYVRDLGGE
ncbi:hypothetical protein [Enterobacter soli]|uniref:hypothetical protein n=1 Tax=Enterobacter soli TaxID=885040 RepID=UPI003F859D48